MQWLADWADWFWQTTALFPDKRILVQIGPLAIRYYALAYIVSLLIGWRVMRRLVLWPPAVASQALTDDFLTWAALGVVLGGRLGYVLFYQPMHFLANPLEIVMVWGGGMSFHGGVLGVIVALVAYTRRHAIPLLGFADRLATVVPIGLGIGRLGNFKNGELWGREAPPGLPWAMRFADAPDHGVLLRHPSQLYEALLEGVVLLTVLLVLARRERVRSRFGQLTGVFLIGYALARIFVEFFREPDEFLHDSVLHNVLAVISMGQILSLPMIMAGAFFIWHARRHPAYA